MGRPLRRPLPPDQRLRRAAEWEQWFAGDRSTDAYRREVSEQTGLPPHLAWELVADVADLLVTRVPAVLGVPALLAVTTLTRHSPKAAEASRALFSVILEELEPAHARTLFESLALSWQGSQTRFDQASRQRIVRTELEAVLRRLQASGASGIDALEAILAVLE